MMVHMYVSVCVCVRERGGEKLRMECIRMDKHFVILASA